jgi:hypothetical protein
MTPRRAFRPAVREAALEDRLVLSHSGNFFEVRAAIREQYVQRFQADYFALGNSLVTAASGDTTNFSTTLQKDVDALNSEITAALGLSPLAASSLTPAVNDLLVGTGSNSLLSQLSALATPAGGGAASGNSYRAEITPILLQSYQQVVADLNTFTFNPFFNFSTSTSGTTASTTSTGGTVTTASVKQAGTMPIFTSPFAHVTFATPSAASTTTSGTGGTIALASVNTSNFVAASLGDTTFAGPGFHRGPNLIS